MGQLFFTDQNGRRWMCGWDNPSQGYYASRENNQPDPCVGCKKDACTPRCKHFMNDWQEFDVLIGFGRGIPTLGDFTAECYEHGFELTMEQVKELADDRTRQERPLTPLQSMIRGIMSDLEEGKL